MNAPVTYYANKIGEASATGLSKFRMSPLEYLEWAKGIETEPTGAMREGTAFHMSQHEPERFRKTYITIPCMPLRSEEDKLDFLSACHNETGIKSLDPNNIAFDLKKKKADDLRDFVCGEVAKIWRQVLESDSLETLRGMAASLNTSQHAIARGIVSRGKKEL